MASSENERGKTLDFSGQGLKKLVKCPQDVADVDVLIADDNELQRLDNLDSYHKITELSLARNQLVRMMGALKLHNLVSLNLANNGILAIEGIKDMPNLRTLCLAGNNIKSIEHLQTNTKLEHLDLSENSISHVADISYLRNLKELLLHNNRLISLRQSERYLPSSLEKLTLSNNNITDLNEMSYLVNLTNLTSFAIENNPCVAISESSGYDYRPFVINWCMNLKSIDNCPVDPIESLKAEWLYSQGRGRQFRVGESSQLAQYLISVCPLGGEAFENETDRKLKLILSKAQHHQQQLSQSMSESDGGSVNYSPATKRRLSSGSRGSPRVSSASRSALSKLRSSPDRMTSSCHAETMITSCHVSTEERETLMTKSLDPSILSETLVPKSGKQQNLENELRAERIFSLVLEKSSPLQAATKLVPVPESLMSPDYRPSSGLGRLLSKTPPGKLHSPVMSAKSQMDGNTKAAPIINTSNPMAKANVSNTRVSRSNISRPVAPVANGKCPQAVKINNYVQSKNLGTPKKNVKPKSAERTSHRAAEERTRQLARTENHHHSSDDDSEFSQAKLDSIRHKATQKRREDVRKAPDNRREKAAVTIQKLWRGYHTRNLNKKATNVLKTIETMRTTKYIQKLSTDMEATRNALENEHKLQLLQMQAINALWKKVVSLQAPQPTERSDGNVQNMEVVNNLTETCTMLHSQVQQLQDSMSEIRKCMTNMQGARPTSVENVVATQTEIVAVHTPAGEENVFPYLKTPPRPRTLQIHTTVQEEDATGSDNRSFASTLVDNILRNVSQSTDPIDEEANTQVKNQSNTGNETQVKNKMDSSTETRCEQLVDIELKDNGASYPCLDGQINEETICKELHDFIETESEKPQK